MGTVGRRLQAALCHTAEQCDGSGSTLKTQRFALHEGDENMQRLMERAVQSKRREESEGWGILGERESADAEEKKEKVAESKALTRNKVFATAHVDSGRVKEDGRQAGRITNDELDNVLDVLDVPYFSFLPVEG